MTAVDLASSGSSSRSVVLLTSVVYVNTVSMWSINMRIVSCTGIIASFTAETRSLTAAATLCSCVLNMLAM